MPERLLKILAEFTQIIINPFDRDELLDQLIGHTLAALDAGAAGLMLADGNGDLAFAAASGPRAAQMEQVQEGSRTGVCYHAFTTNQVVIANDLDDLQRWPGYTDHAIELGFGSVLGVPLNAFGQTIGVLNVYRDQASVWTERATGILMATDDVDADTAFDAIRKASRDSSRKLRDVAQEIVERHPELDAGARV